MADNDTPRTEHPNASSREDDIAAIHQAVKEFAYRWGLTLAEAWNQVIEGSGRSSTWPR